MTKIEFFIIEIIEDSYLGLISEIPPQELLIWG